MSTLEHDRQDYVDISEFREEDKRSTLSEGEARKNFLDENMDRAAAIANKAASVLLTQAPDKALAIATDSFIAYRETLAIRFRDPSTSDEEKREILNEIKKTDTILGPSKAQEAELNEKLEERKKYLGELEELFQEESDRIAECMQKASEEEENAKNEIDNLINQHQEEIARLEKELADNILNTGYDKEACLLAINNNLEELTYYQNISEEGHIYETFNGSKIEPHADMRLYNDLLAEIKKVKSEIDQIDEELIEILFEINPTFETELKYADREQLELCAVKTETIIDYLCDKRSITSMKLLESVAERMEAELSIAYQEHLDQAKATQESGDLASAIEHLKEARNIKEEFPFIDEVLNAEYSSKEEGVPVTEEAEEVEATINLLAEKPEEQEEVLNQKEDENRKIGIDGNIGELLLEGEALEACKTDPEKRKLFNITARGLYERIKELYYDFEETVLHLSGHLTQELYDLISSKFPLITSEEIQSNYPDGIDELRGALAEYLSEPYVPEEEKDEIDSSVEAPTGEIHTEQEPSDTKRKWWEFSRKK